MATNETQLRVPPDGELATQMLARALSILAQRMAETTNEAPDPKDPRFLASLKKELAEFNAAWAAAVDDFIKTGSVSVKAGSPAMTSVHGDFNAAPRLSGEPGGIEGGRVSGLTWLRSEKNAALSLGEALSTLDAEQNWEIEWAELPFCRGGHLWHLWFPANKASDSTATDQDAFAITVDMGGGATRVELLDWTNEKIYKLGEDGFLRVSSDPYAYIRFFFHVVRGTQGRFTILENEADLDLRLPWIIDPKSKQATDERKRIARLIRPIERRGLNAAGETIFRATVLFKNALFSSDVVLNLNGELRLENEELRLEDLHVNGADGLAPSSSPPKT